MDDDTLDEDDDVNIGRPKRKRVMRAGDRLSFPMTMQDGHVSMLDMVAKPTSDNQLSLVVDGLGQAAGHRPGYCFASDASASDQSADPHEKRKRYLEGLWKKRNKKPAPQPQGTTQENPGGVHPPPVGGDGTDLRAVANQAWRDRTQRMQNAYKGAPR